MQRDDPVKTQGEHSPPQAKEKARLSVAQSYPTLWDLWTVAHQAPLSMGFPRPEYWSGLPFPYSRGSS